MLNKNFDHIFSVLKKLVSLGIFRKQLQMKEIYIRQLSAHAAGVSQANEQEDHILKLESWLRHEIFEKNKKNFFIFLKFEIFLLVFF